MCSAASAAFHASHKNPTVRSSGNTGPGPHVERGTGQPRGSMSPTPSPQPTHAQFSFMVTDGPFLAPGHLFSIPALSVGPPAVGIMTRMMSAEGPDGGQVRHSR